MTPPRLRSAAPLTTPGARIELGEAGAHHARVLRLAVGDAVLAFDGEGRESASTIALLSASSLVVTLGDVRTRATDAHAPVLIQCVPKGSKLDDVVRAATEAGALAIHLAIGTRSVARSEGARLERLARIAEEAARQSEAPRVPEVVAPARLLEVAARAPATSHRLVLSPREGVRMRDALAAPAPTPAWLVVGPEGGLDDAETAALLAMGYVLARLDTHVLRTEHAGPIAVAIARELSSIAGAPV